MWRKHPQFEETGITLISSLWPYSVPPHLDAVYQNVKKNVILFFKGKINPNPKVQTQALYFSFIKKVLLFLKSK